MVDVADCMASQPRSISDHKTWLVLLNDEVTVLNSKGPLSRTIAPSVLTEVNEEVKLVTAGQKKSEQDLYELYLSFTPGEKV